MKTPSAERCAWCGVPLQLVWVHGHGQCAACGINCEPCCAGAAARDCETGARAVAASPPRLVSGIEKGS